jgi:hypothetical protein
MCEAGRGHGEARRWTPSLCSYGLVEIETLKTGYPLLLCQGESSGATVKYFMDNRSSTGLSPTIWSHD